MRIGKLRGPSFTGVYRESWHAGKLAEQMGEAPAGAAAEKPVPLPGMAGAAGNGEGERVSPEKEAAAASGIKTDTGRGEEVTEPQDVKNPGASKIKKPGKESSPAECETCKERKYQDGSDEGNVSFKMAAHISPTAAGTAVRAHEQEHVDNAYKKAKQDGGKVLQASVAIHTSICPECGRTYVSGGLTTTKIAYSSDDKDQNPYRMNAKGRDAGLLGGMNFSAGF